MFRDTNDLGAHNELLACAWLMRLGYQTFRNVSSSGPGDIVVWDPETDEKHVIDVKTHKPVPGKSCPSLPKSRSFPSVKVLYLVVIEGLVDGFYEQLPNRWGTRLHYPLLKQRTQGLP